MVQHGLTCSQTAQAQASNVFYAALLGVARSCLRRIDELDTIRPGAGRIMLLPVFHRRIPFVRLTNTALGHLASMTGCNPLEAWNACFDTEALGRLKPTWERRSVLTDGVTACVLFRKHEDRPMLVRHTPLPPNEHLSEVEHLLETRHAVGGEVVRRE